MEDLIHWMFLFLCEKWDSVPLFWDECFHYMNELYFEATADTFWGCRLDIRMIEQAKQRKNFHTKQILGTLEMVMSGILKDDNYLYYTYGLFMGMEDKRLSCHYPCHTDMITYSLSAHKHNIPHFLKKLKKTIKTCEDWGLYKYLTCAMCKRGDDPCIYAYSAQPSCSPCCSDMQCCMHFSIYHAS